MPCLVKSTNILLIILFTIQLVSCCLRNKITEPEPERQNPTESTLKCKNGERILRIQNGYKCIVHSPKEKEIHDTQRHCDSKDSHGEPERDDDYSDSDEHTPTAKRLATDFKIFEFEKNGEEVLECGCRDINGLKPHVYDPLEHKCHVLFSKESCPVGKWLAPLPNNNNTVLCTPNPCQNSNISEDYIALYDNNCIKLSDKCPGDTGKYTWNSITQSVECSYGNLVQTTILKKSRGKGQPMKKGK